MGAGEARRLGQHWMGPEHTLLGILRGDPEDVARRALEQAGVDAAMVEGWIIKMDTAGAPASKAEGEAGVRPNPMWYTIEGRAEGMALALGAERARAVHFLLALLWDQRRWHFTEEPGVSREAIVAALAELGVPLPAAPLPEVERKLDFTPYVEFPRGKASEVLELLAERHPPGSGPTFGFNYKDDESA